MTPAGDVDYAIHGAGYTAARRTDPRIAAVVHAALGDARTVVNVGAGAGSYEPRDRAVTAVEPSAAMRAKRPPDAAPVVDATAEELPFADDAFDAAMAIITIHQWRDLRRGLRELRRVARGPVVVLTFDRERMLDAWLAEYFPRLIAHEHARVPPLAEVTEGLGGTVTVTPVGVPRDCVDGFADAFYARPEAFLEPAIRAGQSMWAFAEEDELASGLRRLRDDLRSGAWDDRHGALRTLPAYDRTLRLVVGVP